MFEAANWRGARSVMIVMSILPLWLGGAARADDASEADKLREQLRATVMQLRELQDQQAAAKAASPAPATPAGPDTAALKARLAAAQSRLRAVQHDAADAAAARADADKAKADLAALQTSAAATSHRPGPVHCGRAGSVEVPARDREHGRPSLPGQERTPYDVCRGVARPLRPYHPWREAHGAGAGDRFHPRSSGKHCPGAGRHHPGGPMRPESRRQSRQAGGQVRRADMSRIRYNMTILRSRSMATWSPNGVNAVTGRTYGDTIGSPARSRPTRSLRI